jgi:hypothetical protein
MMDKVRKPSNPEYVWKSELLNNLNKIFHIEFQQIPWICGIYEVVNLWIYENQAALWTNMPDNLNWVKFQ